MGIEIDKNKLKFRKNNNWALNLKMGLVRKSGKVEEEKDEIGNSNVGTVHTNKS